MSEWENRDSEIIARALRNGAVIQREQYLAATHENHNLRALVRALYAETQGQEVSITRELWDLLHQITHAEASVPRD